MTRVAVLGVGAMGSAMARRLAQCGHDVVVWSRDLAKVAALDGSGIVGAATPADAVTRADQVITMVTDGAAVEMIAGEMLGAMPPGAVWLQTSTVGTEAADRISQLAAAHQRALIDSPVAGTTTAAEKGQLTWILAGSAEAVERARPVLECLGTRTIIAGDAQQASRLKLVVNAWMLSAAVAMADALAACRQLDVNPSTFLEILRGGSLAMPYALAKAYMMTARDYRAGFPVELALKDVRLLTAALSDRPDLLGTLEARLTRGVEAGHGDDDVAAVAAQA